MKLSLFSKGLLLVAVPICFQLVFIASFVHLKSEAEKETNQALKARSLDEHFNDATHDLYALYKLIDEVRTWNKLEALKGFIERYKNGFKPVLDKLLLEHSELAKLTSDDPALHATVLRSETSIKKISGILARTYADISSGNIFNTSDYAEKQKDQLGKCFDGLLADEFSTAAKRASVTELQSIDSEHQKWQAIAVLMLIAGVCNATFSIFLAYYLFRNIIGRLSILQDNTRRIAAGVALNSRVSGDDEIASVDRAFHTMARQLDEAARSKQEMVNMLTHDLRTPLTAIRGSLEILLSGKQGQLNQQNFDLVNMAKRNSGRMMTLIGDLLDIEKISAGMMEINPGKISLQDLLDDAAAEVKGWVTSENIKVEVDCDDIYVFVDEEKLARVLQNLVSNAIKASSSGTTITLRGRVSERLAEVSVSDQGKGIAEEHLNGIFDRFEQGAGPSGKGASSGLGLTISKAIIDLHGGKIWVNSRVGEGTTFYFTVPLRK